MAPAHILLVSGAPASGKSTLACALSRALGFPLLSKDSLKEALYDAAPPPTAEPLQHSRCFSFAATDALLSLAAAYPQVVLEANFRPESEHERSRLLALAEGPPPRPTLEIFCMCSPETAAARFAARASAERHHPAHALRIISAETLAEYSRPIGIGAVIEVSTETPVALEPLLSAIRRHWPHLTAL